MATPINSSVEFNLFTSIRLDPMLCQSRENESFNMGRPSPLYMPSHHRNRILEAAENFSFGGGLDILRDGSKFEEYICDKATEWREQSKTNKDQSIPLRVKCVLGRTGEMEVEFSPVPKISLETLFPTTLDLPSGDEEQHEPPKSFEPSPLTGGALTMGPTDYQPVPPFSSLKPTYIILLDSQSTPYSAHTIFKTTYRPHYDESRSRTLITNPNPVLAEEVLLYNTSNQIMEGSITTPYFFRDGRWVTPPVWEENHGGQRGTTRRYALEKGLCVVEAIAAKSLKDGEKVWISSGVQGFRWGRLQLHRKQ